MGTAAKQTVVLGRYPLASGANVISTVGVALAYFFTARLSLALLEPVDGVAVFWPAAGVASGILIALGSAARRPVVVGVVAATIAANLLGDRNIWNSVASSVAIAGEAVIVAGLIHRFCGSPFELNELQRVLALFAATVVGTSLSGIAGTAGFVLFQGSTASPPAIWLHWFSSDALGIIAVALEPHHPSGEARKLVAGIGQSLDTMTSILSSLLDVNSLESGKLRPSVSEFSLNEIFEPLAGDFVGLVQERGLRLCIVRSELIIRSDRRMLADMIRNLLSNAVRYTDRGRILLGCRRAGDNVRIEVWDSGVGITEDQIPHIFDEYYQGSGGAERGGFGLGLAIVKRLGEILDHKVEVRSISGNGTGFFVEVPRGRSGVEVPETAPSVHPHNDALLCSVLAIEDEASVRSALGRLLKMRRIKATIVATATEALNLVRERGLRPDVLLCDYNLRGSLDGIETIRHLRAALGWNVPAVVMTGDTRSQTLDSISAQGASVLIKPFLAEELLEALRGQEKRE